MQIYDAAPLDKRNQRDVEDKSMENEDDTGLGQLNDEQSTRNDNTSKDGVNTDQQREITEEDINIFLNNEKLEAEGVKRDENAENETVDILKPEIGMEFVQEKKRRNSSTCTLTLMGSQSALFHLTELQAKRETMR
jgi:hypothetical protein